MSTTWNGITYQKEGMKLETVYTIEYIDNKKDFDRLDKPSSLYEPWELYKTKQFTNMQDAISIFVLMYSRDSIYDVKLFEEIKLNGETIQERYLTQLDNFGAITDNETQRIRNTNFALKDAIKDYEDEYSSFPAFLKKYHAEKTYKQFKEESQQKQVS